MQFALPSAVQHVAELTFENFYESVANSDVKWLIATVTR